MDLPQSDRQAVLDRLRTLSQLDIQPGWQLAGGANVQSPWQLPQTDRQAWPIAPLNERGHVAWPQGHHVLWLCQTIDWSTLDQLRDYPLDGLEVRLALHWWADQAEVFVDGERVQTGDLFDCFGRLRLQAKPGEARGSELALRLVSPGHDPGALVRSQLVFERPASVLPEPGFVADELTVAGEYLSRFEPSRLPALDAALAEIDWAALPNQTRFDQSLSAVRQKLMPLSNWLKQRAIVCLGHAHLDMAWLWPVADTWQAAERTFESVLGLQQDYPKLTYTHSTPALFDWLEQHRPALFQAVQTQVKAGCWSIDAGLWVEPELNLIGGEAIVRQILYGQRYCQERFGQPSAIAWLPDSFGFCWQLPQLLRQGEIHCFATQKLRWNDANAFPHELFTWQGRDGSEILALMLPPIGSDIDPVAMARYACDWEANTQHQTCLWLPGVGDHGGGPTRDMLEKARRWEQSPFFPQIRFGGVDGVLDAVGWDGGGRGEAGKRGSGEAESPSAFCLMPSTFSPPSLPTWADELYLELHRGCYTTHADQKWYNRRCEDRLFVAELLAVIAARVARLPYPKAELEAAWKQTLFNQFHDILPGSSIPQVFEEANRVWQGALKTSAGIIEQGLEAISGCIALSPPVPGAWPVLVFNPLNWSRREWVAIPLPDGADWGLCDEAGKQLLSQPVSWALDGLPCVYPPEPLEVPHLLAQVEVPAVGHSVLWLIPQSQHSSQDSSQHSLAAAEPSVNWVLENDQLRVTVNPDTGDLASLYDKIHRREVLSGPGNQLQAFRDQGQYWDAWNIAPDYACHPLSPTELVSIAWLEAGVRQRLRVVRRLGDSTFEQDYLLDWDSRLLHIESAVDWQERQVLVKASFPLSFSSDRYTCEIPFGAIERSTSPQTPEAKAKWEVPALRWADLSTPDYGLTLITDGKHGIDAEPSQLRLTLLKAPLWPDSQADRGRHRFSVALYPHGGDWREARSAHRAIAQAIPPLIKVLDPQAIAQPHPRTALPSSMSFLDSGDDRGGDQVDDWGNLAVILATLKRAEDGESIICRLYEPYGQESPLSLNNRLGLQLQGQTNLLEALISNQCPESIQPWRVLTLTLSGHVSHERHTKGKQGHWRIA